MNLVSKSDWWYPKARNQRGEIWINDSTISQSDLNRIDLIANLCLAEICLGTFKKILSFALNFIFFIVIFY